MIKKGTEGKKYIVKVKMMNTHYKLGDIFTYEEYKDKRMLDFYLQQGYVYEYVEQPKSEPEATAKPKKAEKPDVVV